MHANDEVFHIYVYPTFRTDPNSTLRIEKQAKGRNETDSSLSLDTRLTRVKRLSRKRCCDTTLDRCL